MTVVGLSQVSGSEKEVGERPSQAGASTKGEEKRERGVRKCTAHSCKLRYIFSEATPMLYNIWRDHAGGGETPEEFVSFLADLFA